MMSESFSQLGLAMLFAIGAVYLVMVIAFGEATAPLAIMLSLPLAVVGGLVGLYVAGLPLDMPAMVGALMLIGIVVTNAIVLVDRVRKNLEKGLARRESLLEAGATRMRPIFMTAVATVMALVPLASGSAEGALISQSLAVIVIGGLTTSTLLTLHRCAGRVRPARGRQGAAVRAWASTRRLRTRSRRRVASSSPPRWSSDRHPPLASTLEPQPRIGRPPVGAAFRAFATARETRRSGLRLDAEVSAAEEVVRPDDAGRR